MPRKTTPTQLLARIDNPQWETAEGRVMDEARNTLLALSGYGAPTTVLGGLVLEGRFDGPSYVEGRSIGQIAARAHMDPGAPNHRGDMMQDVLADLIEVGWVDTEEPFPNTTAAALITKPSEDYNPIIHYRLLVPARPAE